MSRLLNYKSGFWIFAIYSIFLIVAVLALGIENNHLIKENAKYINEIEYLKGSNDLLQEDNLEFQDALWHYHDMKNKEMAE